MYESVDISHVDAQLTVQKLEQFQESRSQYQSAQLLAKIPSLSARYSPPVHQYDSTLPLTNLRCSLCLNHPGDTWRALAYWPKNTENTDFHTITSRYTFSLVLKKAHLGNSGTFYMLLQMIFGNSPEKISLVIFIPRLKPNALGLHAFL